jgi:hypothetical protein
MGERERERARERARERKSERERASERERKRYQCTRCSIGRAHAQPPDIQRKRQHIYIYVSDSNMLGVPERESAREGERERRNALSHRHVLRVYASGLKLPTHEALRY